MTTQALNPYKFEIGGKALKATALADGDLLLEGMAAVWEEDREFEAFSASAFDDGIADFVNGTAALCLNHRHSDVLGKVLHLERRPDGLFMRAKVDGALRSDPRLRTIYQQVKSGSIRGASVGGFFRRAKRAGKTIIDRADLVEISLTAAPVGGHRTVLSVVAGKALSDPVTALDAAEHAAVLVGLQLVRLEARAAARALR
jgi:HK97 family phage prohead protease